MIKQDAILNINGKHVSLRRQIDDTFIPKNLKVLKQTVNDEYNRKLANTDGWYTLNPVSDSDTLIHKIESFCFVTTNDLKKEAAILLKSLRQFHSQPVYVICDTESKEFLDKEEFVNVHYRLEAEPDDLDKLYTELKYKKFVTNNFHKPDCIFKKMDVMEYALETHSNTFFLDCDIIVLDNLQENFDKHIVLSPHFYQGDDLPKGFKNGFYNAGYLFCADRGFPKFWKHIYLTKSTFYEQECMNMIPDYYQIQTFDPVHNIGFWRNDNEVYDKVKSFHAHLVDYPKLLENDIMKTRNIGMRSVVYKYTELHNSELYNYIVDICSGN